MMRCTIWYNLHNIKNTRVKHPWRNVTFRKLYTPWVLFTFFLILEMVPNHAKRLKYLGYHLWPHLLILFLVHLDFSLIFHYIFLEKAIFNLKVFLC